MSRLESISHTPLRLEVICTYVIYSSTGACTCMCRVNMKKGESSGLIVGGEIASMT